MRIRRLTCFTILIYFGMVVASLGAEPGRTSLSGHVPEVVTRLTPQGRLPATNQLALAIGLPLRNEAGLDELLRQLYDPASTNFHKFLQPAKFTARFGPTEADYAAVKNFAATNGFAVVGTHGNRLVLDVRGKSGDVERAFHVKLRTFRHPTEARDFFAPDVEPSVPTNLPVADIWGLSDYGRPRPLSHKIDPSKVRPLGGSVSSLYGGNDFRNAYVPGTALNGAGQSVGLLEFSDYFSVDITNYENTIGLTNYVPVNRVVVSGGTPSTANNSEVALDIEVAIAMAPALSQVIVYEINSGPSSILSRMASDNLAKQLSSSWTWSGGPSTTVDADFKELAAQGQSYFQAAGDSDAYTGAQLLGKSSQTDAPVDSTNITAVGGTTLYMNGSGNSWSSETVWNYASYGGTYANEGSGGGISTYYKIPYWQAGLNTNANLGSTVWRNVPDVALTADQVYVAYNNGSSGGFAGTSCAAPLWAGFCALANQLSLATNGTTLGFLNPALYNIFNSSCYQNCFHDITTGNNIGTNTAGLFNAVAGYDLCTGLGTPSGTNLINALVWPPPSFTAQPAGKTVTNGASVNFSATAGGTTPFGYAWLCNGTNLSNGGNVSGVTSNVLSITTATTNNGGSYQLVVTNLTGAVTSSVAVLNVGFAPVVATAPVSQTNLVGSNVVFAASVTGTSPLVFQWRKNGTNISNGTGISGATSNVVTLTAITTNSSGNYSLFTTNIFGVVTSSVAALTVVVPPGIASSSITNRTIQCGSNTLTFTVTASGTTPLKYQWSLDGSPVLNATNTSYSITNIHLPNHTVSIAITNLYGSFASNAVLTVQDTIAPAITLNGASPFYVELGSVFIDPGATATDICAGVVGVIASGTVNTNAVSTNTVTYKAGDGSGNTNTATCTVIVRDTTPPTILWSFTNLVLAANSNCIALMPSVTGTNFILATDLSGALTYSQSPTNNQILFLGTNSVVITVKDASGNAAYSTNKVIVQDQTPPVVTLNGSNLLYVEFGSAFADPGATANDNCAGAVPVTVSGLVNTNAVGTNALTYTASDGNGNTNTVARTVIVRDTTPPTILWSFTNLVLAADTNCSAAMPDVTGTNFILASDLSAPLSISQCPTNTTVLLLGTNVVVIAVADAFGNTAYSTNAIVVQDQTPPQILTQPQSQTNNAGETAIFSAAATACTPLAWQWFFNIAALTAQTNSTLTLSNVNLASVGNYYVVATAAGGSGTSSVATLTVNLLATTVALVSPENPSGFKDTLNFTASVTPVNATGTVQFFTNGVVFDLETLVTGSAASTNLSTLPRGTNLVSAVYSGDIFYSPATNSLAQIVTNHPPVATPAFYTNTASFTLNISIADLSTNWSDVDGDAVSLADFSVSTNGIVLTNTGTALVYVNSNNVADQFTCTITDGWGGTNFQTVTIAPWPAPDTTPLINGVMPAGNGGVTLNLGGAPGSTYILETTADLSASGGWLPVATNTLDSSGVWQFNDAQATNFTQRFYRLKLVQ